MIYAHVPFLSARTVEALTSSEDVVKHPSHYALFPDTEAITVIRKTLSREEYIGYLKGNSLKYRLRAGKKDDALQDLAKAEKYEEFLGDYF
jgi:hypothetical protein